MKYNSETAKVRTYFFDKIVKCSMSPLVLDVGCGNERIIKRAIGVDKNRNSSATIYSELKDLSMFADNSFDIVYSSHFLEHLHNPELMLKEMIRVIDANSVWGNLFLYLPSRDYYKDVNLDHKQEWNLEEFLNTFDHVFKRNINIEHAVEKHHYSFIVMGKKHEISS